MLWKQAGFNDDPQPTAVNEGIFQEFSVYEWDKLGQKEEALRWGPFVQMHLCRSFFFGHIWKFLGNMGPRNRRLQYENAAHKWTNRTKSPDLYSQREFKISPEFKMRPS